MKGIDKPQLDRLREGIKEKYSQYHAVDRDRYPVIEYNTNRANYEPLRASIEEELSALRHKDTTQGIIQIPSRSTLAKLFTDYSYVPGEKLLNACWLYVEKDKTNGAGQSGAVTLQSHQKPGQGQPLLLAGIGIFLLLGIILLVFNRSLLGPSPSGLRITRPASNSSVPQELVVEGVVKNAETVWLAVHYEQGHQYWIQPPVKVQEDGFWVGVAYVGGVSDDHIGLTYQIRAFVNPAQKMHSGETYYDWPQAQLISEILEITRE